MTDSDEAWVIESKVIQKKVAQAITDHIGEMSMVTPEMVVLVTGAMLDLSALMLSRIFDASDKSSEVLASAHSDALRRLIDFYRKVDVSAAERPPGTTLQ